MRTTNEPVAEGAILGHDFDMAAPARRTGVPGVVVALGGSLILLAARLWMGPAFSGIWIIFLASLTALYAAILGGRVAGIVAVALVAGAVALVGVVDTLPLSLPVFAALIALRRATRI